MSKQLSLGRKLPGMQDVGTDHSTGISPNAECMTLLRSGNKNSSGCIQVDILKDKEIMVGKKIEGPKWPEILSTVKSVAQEKEPNMFVVFRSSIDVLLIKYIPDDASVTKKMLYASSASNLKSVLQGHATSSVSIEEFNVSERHEISHEYYFKKKNMPKPLTEMEIFEKEVAKQETAGGYSFLARLKEIETGKAPIPLPGLCSEKVPEVLKAKPSTLPTSKVTTDKLNFDAQKQKWQTMEKQSEQSIDGNNPDKNKESDDDDDDDDDDEQIAALHEVKKFLEKNVSQEDLENDENIWPHQQGLQDLGPFKSVVLYKADLYLNVDLDANKYSLQKEAHGIDGFANEKSNCDMTTLQEVSIPGRDRKLINIPPNAEYYAWLFPAEGINDAETVMGHALDNSPLHVVFQFGGFAYFDKEKKLLTANGVTFGDDLFFDGPYYIPNEEVYSSIESKGIPMKDITIPELRDLDARRFAWLHPSDQDTLGLESEDGSKLPSDYWGFSGAFVYEYEQKEGMEKRRNYFQLLDFKEVGLKKTKNTNTPIVSTLRTFWEKYHEEWSETRKAGDEAPMELLFSSRW